MVGRTISHYRILEKLGGGGMGEVYKAEDTSLGRMVALKFLTEEIAHAPKSIERFRREAYAASALDHPNICSVIEIGEYEGEPFIVMQYLAGETLKQKLGRRRHRTSSFGRREGDAPSNRDAGQSEGAVKPLRLSEILDLGIQVADALEAAHAGRIIHRDIKPANIFVTEHGQAKLLDFGLAKQVTGREAKEEARCDSATSDGPLTSSGEVVGTVEYMSPEQVLSEELDARTDLFSLGLVMYEMATGQRAFSGDSPGAMVNAILHRIPPSPRLFNPDLPAKFEEIISKAVEKDRALRYQTASDLRADLQRLKRDAESEQGSDQPFVTGPRAVWKRPGWVAAGIALLALVAIAMLRVGLNVDNWRDRLVGRTTAPHIESLAVLPLENLSHDPEQEYFADGMTDELITSLARIGSLRIISRNSVMQYKGQRKPTPQIARELNVDAVVEGTVLRVGDRVRITAQLIFARTDRNLWAESYERDLKDVLKLQGDVAGAIAQEIRIAVTPQVRERFAGAPPVIPAAYEAYLRGRYYWNKDTEHDWLKARQYFEQAAQLDPNYAPAYAGLADYYWVTDVLPAAVRMPDAKRYALKALEIDPNLAEAHTSLGVVRFLADWNWPEAEREFRRALELDPGNVDANRIYSDYLSEMGRAEEALAEVRKTQKLDPLSLPTQVMIGWTLYFARQYDEAVEQCRKVVDLEPDSVNAHDCLELSYLAKGKYEEAVAEGQRAVALSGNDLARAVDLARAYALAGNQAGARHILNEWHAQEKRTNIPPYFFAQVHVALGENDQGLAWLEKAYTGRDSHLVQLMVDPAFDSVRSDPRFQDLLHRLELPP
jgi:serine/threonine-protein kinase